MKRIFAAVLFVTLAAALVFAQNGTPSSKATAAINKAVGCTVAVADDQSGTLPQTCVDVFTGDPVAVDPQNFAEIMRARIKVSNSQSLFVSPSLVTGLYTQTRTKTTTGSTSTASGMGAVVVRAVLQDLAGNEVAVGEPVNSCTSAILGCTLYGKEWGVVFDQREQTLTQTLSQCVVNVTDIAGNILTGTCTFDLTTDLILKTTSAHTFNFIFPNVGVGTYDVVVKTAVDAFATASSGSGAVGGAAYGLGSLTVESVRLVHDFSF